MPQVAQAPSFATRNPDIRNSGNILWLSMPLLNTGTATANNVIITSITLGSAARIEPALPLALGDLAADNVSSVNARFAGAGLAVGTRYLATVRGTYDVGSVTLGFTLNRFVVVPPQTAAPITLLAARLQVAIDQVSGVWAYTLLNDEIPGSQRFINAVSIDMKSIFNIIGSPPGWAADTDNASYVLWYSTDTALPYPNHVAPGSSLAGFRVQSARASSEAKAFSITSWDHQTDQADLTSLGTVLGPSKT